MPPARPTEAKPAPSGATRPLLAVGCITRGRPDMFAKALRSLAEMDRPSGVDLVFCFAENADSLSIGLQVEAFRDHATDAKVLVGHEARLGIPFARNKVLDMALAEGCDYLSFIDDDEVVDRVWLTRLYDAISGRGLDLVGGPVRTLDPDANLTPVRRSILKGLKARATRIERAAALRTSGKLDHTVSIVTNNWLARLDFLRKTGIRFDEGLGLSGGSDIAIFREIRAAGGKTGWAPEAFVYEEIPEDRLSLSYQFARGRDQQLATYNIKRDQTGRTRVLSSIGFILSKGLVGCIRVLFSPLFGGTTLVLGLRSFGAAYGRVQGLMGSQSKHYDRVAGH